MLYSLCCLKTTQIVLDSLCFLVYNKFFYYYIILYYMFNNVIEMYAPILARVRQHIPNAVLAGGCLRDTFYDVEVKDLDFVVEWDDRHLYPVMPAASVWLTQIWPDKHFQWAGQADVYLEENNGNGLLDVVTSTDGTVNFIITRNIKQYTNHFPDSISEMVFDGEQVVVSQRWETGNEQGEVYYNRGIQPDRLEKLQRKYPAWEFRSENEFGGEVFAFPVGENNI